MSADQTKLYRKILHIFQTERKEPDPDNLGQLRAAPNTMIIFAKELTDAYDAYAQDVRTYAEDKLISDGKKVMESILKTMEAPGNTAAFDALIISSSITAYWGVAKFSPAPFPPGFSVVFTVITTPPTTPSAPGIQAGILAGGKDTVQANLWASAMHQQTMSVKTTHIGLDTTLPVPLPKTEKDKPVH